MGRQYICYKCREKIIGEEPTTHQVGSSTKKFHKECAREYEKAKEEKEKLDLVYHYLQDILHYDKPLNKIQVQGILNLRAGEMVKRGTKISLSKNGYPYEVILLAMKAKRVDIDRALQTKNFSDEIAKTKYIMAIVSNAINDLYIRWSHVKEQEQVISCKLEKIDLTKTELHYIKTTQKQNDFDELW